MERCYRAHPFNFVNVPARRGQRLAEQGATGGVAEQQQPFRLGESDMAPGDFGAGVKLLAGKAGARTVEAGQARDDRLVRR